MWCDPRIKALCSGSSLSLQQPESSHVDFVGDAFWRHLPCAKIKTVWPRKFMSWFYIWILRFSAIWEREMIWESKRMGNWSLMKEMFLKEKIDKNKLAMFWDLSGIRKSCERLWSLVVGGSMSFAFCFFILSWPRETADVTQHQMLTYVGGVDSLGVYWTRNHEILYCDRNIFSWGRQGFGLDIRIPRCLPPLCQELLSGFRQSFWRSSFFY